MDTFDERERAAEAMFALDLEQDFLARMVRVDLLSEWASRTMGTSPENAMRYRDILRHIAVSNPDDRVIVERVRDDLAAAGVYISTRRVADVLDQAKAAR